MPENVSYAPHVITPDQKTTIEATIRRQLIDPDSAKFEDLVARKVISPNGIGYQVCGHVNSKNRFGGYVGRTPFAGAFSPGQPDKFIVNAGPDQQFAGATYYACSGLGLNLS